MHLSKVARDGTSTYRECIEFYHNGSEADFLFNKTITDKIEEIFKNSNELSSNVDIRNIDILPIGNQKPNPAEKRAGLMVWHFDQLEVIKKEFSKQTSIKFT